MKNLIGVDWGSSNLRAYRFAADGSIEDVRYSAKGIIAIRDGEFEDVLGALIGDWLEDAPDIVMAGMIGSRDGWLEVPYLPCPVGPQALAGAVRELPSRLGRCAIVPGLSTGAQGGLPDVMRGEETQLLGADVRDGQVVLPGTHSKWATLSRGEIETFRTAMTGELYAVLLDHSLLGRLAVPSAKHHDDAFAQGVARSLEDPSLVLTLFSARASVLAGCLSGEAVGAYLSGLLIGAEVAAMVLDPTVPLTLIGEKALCRQYSTALALAGVHDLSCISGDAAMSAGLWRIWEEWTCN